MSDEFCCSLAILSGLTSLERAIIGVMTNVDASGTSWIANT